MIRQIAARVHAALGRWLADPPVAPQRKRTSWFDCEPGALELPRSAEDEESEAWYRAHFKINGQPPP